MTIEFNTFIDNLYIAFNDIDTSEMTERERKDYYRITDFIGRVNDKYEDGI